VFQFITCCKAKAKVKVLFFIVKNYFYLIYIRMIYILLLLLLLYLFLRYSVAKFFFKKEHFMNLRVANEIDHKRATKYALKKICESRGYSWIEQGDEFTYDCKHTEETCKQSSVYPTKPDDVPSYYEWRDKDSTDAKIAAENAINLEDKSQQDSLSKQMGESSLSQSEYDITRNGICIIGNEYFREMCEKEGLDYDVKDGSCKVNRKYCYSKCLSYCNGDCFQPPDSVVWEFLLGTTAGRAYACASGVRALTEAACLVDDASKGRKITY
jgi:hypothetical protein